MRKAKLSEIVKQVKDLAVKNPDEIRKMAEIAETVIKSRKKIMAVFTNPKIICSGDGNRIAKALKGTGLKSMFASLDPSIWRMLNPVSTAHAAAPVHQMSFELGVTPPLPGKLNGFSIGIGFATDFDKNHSLTLPSISYAKSISKNKSGDDGSVFDISTVILNADVGLTLGWAFWDGRTDWGLNDVFNWGASIDVFGPLHINFGSGGFGGISLTPLAGKYEKKTVADLFGDVDVTKSKSLGGFELSIGGAIGGGFNVPLN